MRLSVVIVNYNVRYYLEQCLRSVYAGSEGVELEVWVVDNNSTDGSVQMVRELFPQVRLVVNEENVGFARANNQALREILKESGEGQRYVLLLNPDTLVQEDTLRKCLDFFASHEDCGALSVKMVDGEGRFLKESKRGFPSPAVSFYKISGLIRLFPRNKRFGAYYMGHLDEEATNEVDVLPGAFLMMSVAALEQTGLLDESYFMYGEDIDFSWRIHLAGFKNYYLPATRILHYKGESTRKSSMNYVYTFYNAMAIFARKYFSGSGARMYTLLIQLAIWLRASVDFVKRIVERLAVPVMDFAVSLAGFYAIKMLWAAHKTVAVNYYPEVYTWVVLPVYVLILLLGSWLAGGYDKPVRAGRIMQGMGVGALCLLVFYSLLNEELRFSRAIVLLGSLWSIAAVLGIRGVLHLACADGYRLGPDRNKRYLVVGSEEETERLMGLFDSLGIEHNGVVVTHDFNDEALTEGLPKVDEVVFCSRDVPTGRMLDIMQQQAGREPVFRILPEGMNVLIGSNYIGSAEELYKQRTGDIGSVTSRRSKRLVDLAGALMLLVLSPLLFWIQQRKRRYFADCVSVLTGRKSWVGYNRRQRTEGGGQSTENGEPLPAIRRGVFCTRDQMPRVKNADLERLDRNYAENYSIWTDITILVINLNKI